jgi:hypothetical protein
VQAAFAGQHRRVAERADIDRNHAAVSRDALTINRKCADGLAEPADATRISQFWSVRALI